jgi:hypothetical protein
MINVVAKLLNSYYTLLNGGGLSYNSVPVDVYKSDIPGDQERHYVYLRPEGETYGGNKRSFADQVVIIVDVVTIFKNNIDSSVSDNIDNQIGALLLTSPAVSGLGVQAGLQILNVVRESTNYLMEDDGVNKYYRKVCRYNQRVLQT